MAAAREPVGEGTVSFARPDLFPLVFIVPAALALALWLYARRRRRIAELFGEDRMLARLGGAELRRFPLARFLLIVPAGAALAFAAAGPRWGLRAAEGSALALNVVLATDISRSMLAEDIEPNRLERGRLFARRLLRELRGDRFGLVVFAGRAYVLSPLTVDHSAIELYIDALDPSMVSQGGSSLASALTQATDLVRASDVGAGDRAVLLLTDGEALEERDAVLAAADRAARARVRVITVGIGTPSGATVPDVDPSSGDVVGVKHDEYGEVVISRLDDELLRDVAARTNGTHVRIDDAAGLVRVISELRNMQRGEGNDMQRVEARERFWIFALIGLLLLALDALLHGSRRARARGTAAASAAAKYARAAVLVLVLFGGSGFGIGDLERGNRLYRAGKYEDAVAAYQKVLDSGKATPQLHYNLATALLALGRYTDAEPHFEAALQGVEPELRQRTFYNLGNRFLRDAREQADVQRQGELLEGAIEAYKRALRLTPDDVDAKWNLELALRDREENEQKQQDMQQQQQQSGGGGQQQQQQQSQGGGSGSSPSRSQAGAGQDAGATREQRPMSQDQADRILSAVEQDERELTREKLRRGQRRTPVLRDW
jgi:Ca-activated chloride channel family protein